MKKKGNGAQRSNKHRPLHWAEFPFQANTTGIECTFEGVVKHMAACSVATQQPSCRPRQKKYFLSLGKKENSGKKSDIVTMGVRSETTS